MVERLKILKRRNFKNHLPLGPRQVLPRQVCLVVSQGRTTCLHRQKIQCWHSQLASTEPSTLSVWHHGTKKGMHGSCSWYVADRSRTSCHEIDPTVLCAHVERVKLNHLLLLLTINPESVQWLQYKILGTNIIYCHLRTRMKYKSPNGRTKLARKRSIKSGKSSLYSMR
jgi:hypothetical protein